MMDRFQRLDRAHVLRLPILIALTLALATTCLAQRASITGVVTDQSGRMLSAVRITLLNVDQGLQREALTSAEGEFSVPWLQPGRYVVTGQKDGFAVAEIKDIVLHVGDSRSVHLELLVGASPIRIEVDGHAQSVETVSSALGQVVTADVIRNAPLNGRNVLDLAVLQPGVTPTDDDDSSPNRFNVSGNRSDSVSYQLDGAPNNNLLDNGIVYNPNPDTVDEFRILTSNYPADYGRNSGGVVSVITKSGTSNFHGSVYDYFRNDALDANSYFNKNDPANLLPRPPLKRNQFGATLGGPLALPASHSSPRLFFFTGYQGQRQIQGIAIHGTSVYTPDELEGDFSKAANGAADPDVANFLRKHPFFQQNPTLAAQAIIDPTRINPAALNYIAAGLIPQSPTGLLNSQRNATNNLDEFTAKVDFAPRPSNHLAVTFGWDRVRILDPYPFANVPGFADFSHFGDVFSTISYTRFFSPTLLNELRGSFHRATIEQEFPAETLPTPNQLGIAITPDLPSGPSNLVFDFGLALGPGVLGPSQLANNTFAVSDTLTWVRGRHTWKFGGGFSPFQNNSLFAFYVNGRFDFISTRDQGAHNSFANFLLGIPESFTQSPAAASNIRTKFTHLFVQDEWHARKSLVLTLGGRYEYSTPKNDTQGRTFSIIPGLQSQRFPNAPTGMVFPGDPGAPRGVNFPDKNDWAARAGFAWDLTGDAKTSLRGGFGVFYDILKGEDNLQFNGQPPFYSSVGLVFPPPTMNSDIADLPQPFAAAGQTNPFPSHAPPANIDFDSAGFLPIGSSGSVFVVDPHLRTPYTYQYSLSLQRALGRNTLAEANYVGSSSHGLTALIDANPFVLGTNDRRLNLQDGEAGCTSSCSFASLPEFRNLVNASFNSLQLSLRKQFSDGRWFGRSYFTLAYTYSHNIDDASGFRNRNTAVPSYQPNLFRASADMDMTHRLVFSGGWDLPFDKVWNRGPRPLLAGWSVFPIVSYRSGFPIDVLANLVSPTDFLSVGPSGAGDPGLVRANLVSPVRTFDPRSVHNFTGVPGNYWFDPTSFSNAQCNLDDDPTCVAGPAIFPADSQAISNPAVRTYGSLSRNFIRGPGRFNVNLAFAKSTPLFDERLHVEFRTDFFNLFNRAQFRNPNTNITDVSFGKIQNTYDPRVIQLAIRLTF